MIILIVYWFIIFLFASLSGIAFQNLFGLSKTNTSFTLLFGFIFQTLFLSFCAFFSRIHSEVFLLNCFIQLLIFFKYKTEYKAFTKNIFNAFSKVQFYLFIGLTILIALKSAQLPTIFDNESYYIQTIKWLNEYGFVKGVANVHPFLGQFSFWHVLQSGFNFPFLAKQFNDINGFVLLTGIFYFFEKNIKSGLNWSFFGILFLFFYYQFIDSPSSDLPILVLTSIVFYEFIENSNEVKSILLFIIYIIFLKVTIATILFIAFFYIIKNKKLIPYFGIISLLFGSFWVLKNIIITGLPLFPLAFFPTNFDWTMSQTVLNKLTQITIDAGFTENLVQTDNLSLFEKLKLWLNLDGINAIFNKGILFLFVIIPFTKFFKSKMNFRILYFIVLIHFAFLLITSPQYRFFLSTFILFATIIFYEISRQLNVITPKIIIIFSVLLITFSLFIDIKNISNKNNFKINQLIIPETITKYKTVIFEEKTIGSFKFYNANFYNLYETSNGKLPCVNEKLFKYYNYFPQQRTNDIKDGFYPKEINHE